ncbi:MAG TPA: FecR family protein [Bacteroides sp.]|nr:FecR family protein [Bacteroides sp.]
MPSSQHIKRLLDEFISGKITPEDENDLFDFVNNHDIDSTLIAWMYKKWTDSPKRSVGFHSEGANEKIRRKLNLPDRSSREEREYANHVIELEKRKKGRFIPQIFRIAAVLALALIGSYLVLMRSGYFTTMPLKESYSEVFANNGSKSTIVLPDSSIIILNSGSYLRYPVNFHGKNRWVYFEGEAFFNIKTGKAYPFYVNTGNISIRVTGTEFNVKSFPEDQFIETTLISGSIIIEELDEKKQLINQIFLNPNQFAVYDKNTNKIEVSDLLIEDEIIPKQAVRVEHEPAVLKTPQITVAWKDDKFVFYNESLEEIAIRMERWYDTKIVIQDEELKKYRYSGTFEDENIEQALDALKLAASFEFQINNNQITIKR